MPPAIGPTTSFGKLRQRRSKSCRKAGFFRETRKCQKRWWGWKGGRLNTLSHLNSKGEAQMVDVSPKNITYREAKAYGEIRLQPEVVKKIKDGATAKGNVLAVAKIAGILAAKRVDELIPLCHSLNLDSVDLKFKVKNDRVTVESSVKTSSKTGAEMEALTAVSLACLAIYDMVKALDREMTIGPIYLLEKKGGLSGHYIKKSDTGEKGEKGERWA